MAKPAIDEKAIDAEAAALGINIIGKIEDKTFKLWRKNLKPFKVFNQLQTQWVRNQMNGKQTGLDYSAVKILVDLYTKKNKKRLFEDIQLLEMGYLKEIMQNDN